MKEIWKEVVGYEGRYEVSNFGRVRNAARGNILNPTLQPPTSTRNSNTRYYKVTLGQYDKHWLHRIVALAHVPNLEGKAQVDHIDGNGCNNRADNLRWVTQSENVNNPTTKRRAKRVKLINGETLAEISRRLGDSYGHLVSKRLRKGWCKNCASTVPNMGMGGSRKFLTCTH